MEQKNINFLVLAFVFLIIGVALIGSVASNVSDRTDKVTILDEALDISAARLGDAILSIDDTHAFTITNYPTSWKILDCPITDFVFKNQTGVATTVASDYAFFPANGTLVLVNSSVYHDDGTIQILNTTTMDYTYCADDYLNSTWGRSVLNTVPGFFALALLGISLWLFYSVFASVGIIKR